MLSTAQLDVLRTAAAPLPRPLRTRFLQRVGEALNGRASVGDGELHRLAHGVVREIAASREGGVDPVALLVDASRTIREFAMLTIEQKRELLDRLDPPTIDVVVRMLTAASDIAARAAAYRPPKVTNKITVRLKLGAEPPEWARHRISEMK